MAVPVDGTATSVTQLAASPVRPLTRTSRTLELLEGIVTITLADGSTLSGTYHGTNTIPSSGPARATLDGVLTGGTGEFAGAKGTLSGTGTGGFSDDGPFSVALRAIGSTGNGVPLDVRASLKGTSTSACTTTAPPRMFLDGTGTAKSIASATGHLEHNLGSQICAIIVE
jgi:hypothetical protein